MSPIHWSDRLSHAIERASAHADAQIAHAARELGILLADLRIRIEVPGASDLDGAVAQANAYTDGRAIRVQMTGGSIEAAGARRHPPTDPARRV
ncbi:MAG TPA: hypothetical protein VL551_06070 [Actinospica sp.]|jgi:hypothetical protein|nr:hypothetical protein [Actinospica sp.]